MNRATIAGKTLIPLMLALSVSGCGLTQKVSEGTVSVTKSIFYKQIRTLHLDFRAREGANRNAQGAALSTVVRIWQLKDSHAFDASDYPSLFTADSQVLKADLLAQKDIRIRPGESVSIDMPMDDKAEFVAVAGLFLSPDSQDNKWRLLLTRDDLDPDSARVIELGDGTLTLVAEKAKRP
ncbi:type VI secretion protein [Pantoea sp. BL1]|uniref:type VI secretion system lipoprotein TssJ n=1 Tax=Pantoea sp. BL1 TaxID=1628190 RepID=UPI0005F778E5|nr:type VI secretion system lipoprotein TssJ [Pantoea sp. BL1]KJV44873.1 type VI secretion protein [Pantoea sp. BL1]